MVLVFKEWEQAKSFSPSATALNKSLLYNSSGKQSDSPDDLGLYSLVMNKELQGDIKALKRRGMRVLLDIMPDHENAGWARFKNSNEAKAIARQINNAINEYEVDGIDIDEEYARYAPGSKDEKSMTRVLHELSEIWKSEEARHPGKKLMPTKSLYADTRDFKARLKVKVNGADKEVGLASYLTEGWDMNYYSTANIQLPKYITYGMRKEQLGAGLDFTGPNKNEDGIAKAESVFKFGCGYMMY